MDVCAYCETDWPSTEFAVYRDPATTTPVAVVLPNKLTKDILESIFADARVDPNSGATPALPKCLSRSDATAVKYGTLVLWLVKGGPYAKPA